MRYGCGRHAHIVESAAWWAQERERGSGPPSGRISQGCGSRVRTNVLYHYRDSKAIKMISPFFRELLAMQY